MERRNGVNVADECGWLPVLSLLCVVCAGWSLALLGGGVEDSVLGGEWGWLAGLGGSAGDSTDSECCSCGSIGGSWAASSLLVLLVQCACL